MRVTVLAALAVFSLPALAQTPPAANRSPLVAPLAADRGPPGPAPAPDRVPSPAPASATAPFTPEQRREIVEILREALRTDPGILGEALRDNPLVLREAFEALQALEARDREALVRAAIADNRQALFHDQADPVRGNPAGTVAMVEFFDARCPYCKQLNITMGDLVRRNPDVRVVLKDLPVLGPNSTLSARALLAAHRQGKYNLLHDALLKLREEPTEAVIRREAERVGIDWSRLRREMDDPAITQRIAETRRLAEQLRVEGTPAIVVGDTLLPGAVDLATLERMVEAERNKARRGG